MKYYKIYDERQQMITKLLIFKNYINISANRGVGVTNANPQAKCKTGQTRY